MDSPLIRDGAVAIAGGRILLVGPSRNVIESHPDAQVIEFSDSILLPGLINAHTHLELSDHLTDASPAGRFTDWILSMRNRAPSPEKATHLGIAQCLKFGVTCVGDISQQSQITRPIIAKSPLRCVSFGEVLGLGKRRARFEELLPIAIDEKHASSKLRIGLSPHAPYTVDLDGYRQCLEIARKRSLPLATHLAENMEERAFLESHSGMFRDLWEQIGSWDDRVETFRGSPIAMARAIELLEFPTLLAHVNYCGDEEIDALSIGKASVVYCPRTHAWFGHRPHRWREMLARGINVAVGTDSCASSPDLNLIEELKLLRQIAPEIPAQTLWEMATIRAARALSLHDEIGSIAARKRADFVAIKIDGDDPLEELLRRDNKITTWIDGAKISGSVGN